LQRLRDAAKQTLFTRALINVIFFQSFRRYTNLLTKLHYIIWHHCAESAVK